MAKYTTPASLAPGGTSELPMPTVSSCPATSVCVPANRSMVVTEDYEVPAGVWVELSVGAWLEIL